MILSTHRLVVLLAYPLLGLLDGGLVGLRLSSTYGKYSALNTAVDLLKAYHPGIRLHP